MIIWLVSGSNWIISSLLFFSLWFSSDFSCSSEQEEQEKEEQENGEQEQEKENEVEK